MPVKKAPSKGERELEPAPNRKRWTRADCEFLIQNELLVGRYELIDGEVISKMGQNPPHALVVMLIADVLLQIFGRLRVQTQLPIDVAAEDNSTNEPEPDVAVLAQPITAFLDRHPGPADLLLVVEVSDSTVRFDLRNKALLYASAGISEYWVADIGRRCLIVHHRPTSQGYEDVQEYAEIESLSPLAKPEAVIPILDLLPPVAE